jgi:hypothetical protein
MTLKAKYLGEELCVEYRASSLSNHGIDQEVDDDSVEVTDLSIMGVDLDMSDLPDALQNAIMSMSYDCPFE